MEVCCTHCGCNDVDVLSEPESVDTNAGPWITPGRGLCNHCGKQFQWSEDNGHAERTRPLTYDLHCPECNTPDTHVRRTMPPEAGYRKRYMGCINGHLFKTIDPISPQPKLHTRFHKH